VYLNGYAVEERIMWKRKFKINNVVLIAVLGAIAFGVSWLLVFKFGWRYMDIYGIIEKPLAANQSFIALSTLVSVVLLIPLSFILAIKDLVTREERIK
jgi:hypothetical protein